MTSKQFPKALNWCYYTFMFEGEYKSAAEARWRFRELRRDVLPDDAKYRILKIDYYRVGLYIW